MEGIITNGGMQGTGQETALDFLNISSPHSTGFNHKISVILHKGPMILIRIALLRVSSV